jgi:hypothetical protein
MTDRETGRLPPAELAARLDRVLGVVERLVGSVPVPYLEHRSPPGGPSVRELAYLTFRLSLAYPDAMDVGRLPESWLRDQVPPDLRDGASVARYGALVRGRLGGWFDGAGAGEYARVIDVYDGPLTGHALLERTTTRAAQHLRQLHASLEELGIAPPEPLPLADLEGLPLPPTPGSS